MSKRPLTPNVLERIMRGVDDRWIGHCDRHGIVLIGPNRPRLGALCPACIQDAKAIEA
jgi:hypothetical protein